MATIEVEVSVPNSQQLLNYEFESRLTTFEEFAIKMTEKEAVTTGAAKPTLKTPLRTYSRRSIKRSLTSVHEATMDAIMRRTKSLAAEQTIHDTESSSQQMTAANSGRKRSTTLFPNNKSNAALERSSDEDVATQSASKSLSENQDIQSSEEDNGNDCDADDEESEDEDGEKTRSSFGMEQFTYTLIASLTSDKQSDSDNTAPTTSSSSEKQSTPPTAAQKPATRRSPFLIFDKTPPKGFKVLQKPVKKTAPTSTKRKSAFPDGFSSDEARPSPNFPRKRRYDVEPDIGSLELQTSSNKTAMSQRQIKPLKSRRSPTAVSQTDQHFGSVQFDVDTSSQAEDVVMDDAAASVPYGATASALLGELSEVEDPDDAFDIFHLLSLSPSPTKRPRRDDDTCRSWNTYEVSASEFGEGEDSIIQETQMFNVGVQTTQSLSLRPQRTTWA